jgi:hypothetical protein
VDVALAIGREPEKTLAMLADSTGAPKPQIPTVRLKPGEALAWWRTSNGAAFFVRTKPPLAEHRRHVRKYAAGELIPEEHFFFRGPDGRLNLRVHNLMIFVHIADGVDEDTWLHHLRRHDYSEWFRRVIKDPELADEAAAVEGDRRLSAAESLEKIREAIETRYTGPA